MQCQLNRKRIVDSNKEGVTRLCSKVSGIPAVDELRPITLLNCDYKLLSKCLVQRIRPKLHLVIKSGQLCSIERKNILFGVSNIVSSILNVQRKRSHACLISLDFYKAYDRVFLAFLIKVLKKMNFGHSFIAWIAMLHEGATTRFLLDVLSQAIEVRFSIRQGDPISMILYIIYIEPLLLALERNLRGLQIPNIVQVSSSVPEILEAYCDDINVVTDDLSDFLKLSATVTTFERFSGAILSRNRKCKVLGLGKWSTREDWPLTWLQCVDSVKMFGIFVSNSYVEMIRMNWEYRLDKFKKVLLSWNSRIFFSLQQKVEVVKIFALSRIYYVASILPMRKGIVKKLESMIGKFLWSGLGIMKIALDELKNPKSQGGLGLPCILSMNKALMSSQCLRLLRSQDEKSIAHLDFWMGPLLTDIFPMMGQNATATVTPEYFSEIGECLAELMVKNVLTSSSTTLANRIIYRNLVSLPQPKVMFENIGVSYTNVWKRLHSPAVPYGNRDVMLRLIHNKLPVQERLCRIGIARDPWCPYCTNESCDLVHFFCNCIRTKVVWSWLRLVVIDLKQEIGQCSNWDLLNLMYPKNNRENEVAWLISFYVEFTWNHFLLEEAELDLEKFFGFLSFKYKSRALCVGEIRELE